MRGSLVQQAIRQAAHEVAGVRALVGTWIDVGRGASPRTVELDGTTFTYHNEKEFRRIYHDIFVGDEYRFEAKTDAPYILDCGAHIGLATLYLKKLYPDSSIVAFEPNPDLLALLRTNLSQNGVEGVDVVNAALATDDGKVEFWVDWRGARGWTWGGTAEPGGARQRIGSRRIVVPSVRLSSYLTRPVDLLKLDIEGLEAAVLAEAADRLGLVERVILEYHGNRGSPGNELEDVLATLERAGFRTSLKQGPHPVALDEVRCTTPYWLIVRGDRE